MLKKVLTYSLLIVLALPMLGCGGSEDTSAVTTDQIINGKREIWQKVSQEQRVEACRSILAQVGQTGTTTPEDLAACVDKALEKQALSKVVKVAANCLL